MAKEKVVDKNHPKSLTTEQRLYLDQLVSRFPDITMVKRADLKKATQEILKIKAAPDWITRNLKCRCVHKRGRYDLSVLLKLPVVAFASVEKKPKKVKTPKAPKVPVVPKEPKAPKVPEKKESGIKKALEEVKEIYDLITGDDNVPEILDGIPPVEPVV